MAFHPEDPTTWPCFRPLIMAHDVARAGDRSTVVIGGLGPVRPPLTGVVYGNELPQGLYGHGLANELVSIDRKFQCNALIIADISRDDSYAEILYQAFGRRVIGLQITRYGDGSQGRWREVQNGSMLFFSVGRTYLFDLLLAQLQANQVRLSQDAEVRRSFDQLTKLEVEMRQSGKVYTCPPGQHDDLGISLAMLVWAAQHPMLERWARALERRPRRSPPKYSWDAFT
jgi:hypothetical protein